MTIHDEMKYFMKECAVWNKDPYVLEQYIKDVKRYFELQEMWNLDTLYSDIWTEELDKEYRELREKLTKGIN